MDTSQQEIDEMKVKEKKEGEREGQKEIKRGCICLKDGRFLIEKPFFCFRFVTSGERQAPRAVLVNDIQQVVVDVYLVNLSLLWATDRPRLDPSEQHVDTHSIRGSRRGVGGGESVSKKRS